MNNLEMVCSVGKNMVLLYGTHILYIVALVCISMLEE